MPIFDHGIVTEQGPSDFQEDAALVVCLPDRWMIAVADGCGGGPDDGEAAIVAVEAAEKTWRTNEQGTGPEPDLAAMIDAADKAVLALPCGSKYAHAREEIESKLRNAGRDEFRDINRSEILQKETGRGSIFHQDNRDDPYKYYGMGFWGPATTIVLAIWDQQRGLRWAVGGDSWLFAIDADGQAITLETPRLRLSNGGCLGVAKPRPYYGRIPNVDGWVVFAATDGLYPGLVVEYEEELLPTIADTWRNSNDDINSFLSSLIEIVNERGFFDNATGVALKIPAIET